MLLSIAMIVRDEEKYLDKTLSSLQPLMKEVESELIIVDTGSVDRTVEIAKKYTDKVYFKEWSGNFAEMRNESIKYTSGEWLLIVDADEELVDYSEFIKFINSDKSKHYNTGIVKLNNFVSENLERSVEATIPRLFRNDKDFKYQSTIHEQPCLKNPIYNHINGIFLFNHYGYIYEDESIRQKKMKRNEDLLIEELNKNPNDPYMNYQLGQNYMVLNKIQKAVKYLEKSVLLHSKMNLIYTPASVHLMRCYQHLHEHIKCENMCLKYLKKIKNNPDVYYYLAITQYNMCKYVESVNNFKKYFYYMENYSKTLQASEISSTCETRVNILKAVEYYCLSLSKLGKHLALIEFIKSKKNIIGDKYIELYFVLIEAICVLGRYNELLNYYNEYTHSDSEKRLFIQTIENYILVSNIENISDLYEILSTIEGNYGILNSFRIGKCIDSKIVTDILNKEVDSFYGELIVPFINSKSKLIDIISKIESFKISLYFNYIFKHNKACISIMYDEIFNLPVSYDIKDLQFKTIIMETLIFSNGLSKERKYLLYKYYISEKYRLIKIQYSNKYTDEELLNMTINKSEYIVLKMKILNELKEKNGVKYLKEIKDLMIKHPEYKDIFELLVKEFVKEKEHSVTEIAKIKKQYITVIENYINNNRLELAEKMINEYIDINNVDEYILNIKSIYSIIIGNYEEAINYLEESYKINGFNYDVIYNLAFANELIGNIDVAKNIYEIILLESNDENLKTETKEHLNEMLIIN